MINKIKIHCRISYAITKCILYDKMGKKKKKPEAKDGILVLFTPYIGDTILYLNVLRELPKYYHSQGKKCYIITRSQDKAYIQKYCEYDEVYLFEFGQYIMDKTYRESYKNWLTNREYEAIINPYFDSLLDADLLSVLANSKVRIAADRRKIYPGKVFSKSIIKNSLRKRAYTKLITCDEQPMDFMKQSYFMKEIGIPDFKARISCMEEKDVKTPIPINPYCIIAPGASKPGKRWETEKFAQIIEKLVQDHNLIVFICGSKHETYICNDITKKLKESTRKKVINYMGRTSLLEYLELIRNAKVVISNDSSPVHMAASVGTPCVCIIGGWDYHRLLPYVVEKEDEETVLPVPIYPEVMSCFNCFDHHVAYGNKECKSCIKTGYPYPCIKSISVEDVEKATEQILREQEGGCQGGYIRRNKEQ